MSLNLKRRFSLILAGSLAAAAVFAPATVFAVETLHIAASPVPQQAISRGGSCSGTTRPKRQAG